MLHRPPKKVESLNKLSDKEKSYIAQLPIKVTLDTPGYLK
jgi:hypothetical protein